MSLQQNIGTEVAAYVEHLNNLLKGDEDLKKYLPLTGQPDDLFQKCRDGILLSKTVNAIRPSTIDLKKLTFDIPMEEIENGAAPGSRSIFQVSGNQNAFIEGAGKLGLKLVNIGSQDIIDGNPDLVLGVIWQLVRHHLLQHVHVNSHPELIRLLESGETMTAFVQLPPETLLLRWFNYHLKRTAASSKSVVNFSESVKDSICYIHLLSAIAPKVVTPEVAERLLGISDLEERAKAVLTVAEELGARKFVTAKDIVNGNNRLNLAFTATLFNKMIGIRLPSEEEIAKMFDKFEEMKLQIEDLTAKLETQQSKATEAQEKNEKIITGLQATVDKVTSQNEQQQEMIHSLDESLNIAQQQNSNYIQQISSLENELQQSKADLLKSSDDKLQSLQQRHDSMMDDMRKQILALQEQIIVLTTEKGNLKNENLNLETKLKRQKEMNDVMTGKVYEIAEELNQTKKNAAKK